MHTLQIMKTWFLYYTCSLIAKIWKGLSVRSIVTPPDPSGVKGKASAAASVPSHREAAVTLTFRDNLQWGLNNYTKQEEVIKYNFVNKYSFVNNYIRTYTNTRPQTQKMPILNSTQTRSFGYTRKLSDFQCLINQMQIH